MAAYVQFYLNRGAVGRVQVAPAADIERMEFPSRTWEAQQGLKAGYGLSNYTSVLDGFVYHGHDGGVNGGITDMAYLPEAGVGYFYSINSANGDAFSKIGSAIRAYVTRSLQRPPVPAVAALPVDAAYYAGWYEPASPRNEVSHFMERLLGLQRVRFAGGNMLVSSPSSIDQPFVPVGGEQFRYLPRKDHPEPIATVALIAPNAEGRFIFAGGTLRRIPTWLAYIEIFLVAWFVLAFFAVLIYAPFWIFGGLIKSRRRPDERAMRLWPLVAVLSLLGFVGFFLASSDDMIARLGQMTFYSLGLFLTTLMFAAASIASVIALWDARKHPIRRLVRWFSICVTSALLVATIYFAWWGVICIRTWG
jgi:hypothetical protein